LSSEPTFAPAADDDPIERLIEKKKELAAEGPIEDPTTKTKRLMMIYFCIRHHAKCIYYQNSRSLHSHHNPRKLP
jgi:hypothetical protein